MVQAVRMPKLGNTMETGILVEWRVEEGDEVADGDVLAVVESEKASADVTANQAGRLARVDLEEEEGVPPGTVMGIVLGPDEEFADAPEPRSRIDSEGTDATGGTEAEPSGPSAAEPEASDEPAAREEATSEEDESLEAVPGARKLASEHGVSLGDVEGTGSEDAVLRADIEEHLETSASPSEVAGSPANRSEATRDGRFASPSIRRLAREHGVSLTALTGTGISGRVTESDVRRAAGMTEVPDAGTDARGGAEPESRTSDADALGVTVTEEPPLTGTRRTIASRMSQSAREAPHVTLDREVQVDHAEETVENLSDARDVAIGFTDLLIASAVRALETYPVFNAWFEDERLRLVNETNVAVAVDAPQGLLTPVIRETDQLSLEGIAGERRRLTDSVLASEHTMDDLQAGTFTISNLGMFGVDAFDPIINPPQIAILGVGQIREAEGRRICTLSLSFDHRAVDGADAARFLDVLADGIEAPSVVVDDRAWASASKAADDAATSPPNRTQRPPEDQGRKSVTEAIQQDLANRAAEIAQFHNWPTPTFQVRLDGGQPTVVVRDSDDASPATLKRLTYAACRDSEYADVVVEFHDPAVEFG